MSEIANNTAVIAYNTEKTAFYAKKNAELVEVYYGKKNEDDRSFIQYVIYLHKLLSYS